LLILRGNDRTFLFIFTAFKMYLIKEVEVDTVLDPVEAVWREVIV
jgi:hypothetical protein